MKKKTVNIGIVGLGNIGSNLYKYIQRNQNKIYNLTGSYIKIKYVSAKNLKKKRSIKINKKIWVKNPFEIIKKDVDIIVELIGGSDGIAKKLVENSLRNKKHVITANKSLIAKHGDFLSKIAEKNKVNLEFEASVAGGVPIIRSIKDGLIANKIDSIIGILNGTSNFILTKMDTERKDFKTCLMEAQKKGFAEPNPKNDLNGDDVKSKIKILSALAFNSKISKKNILCEGIENIDLPDVVNANNFGYKIKLLGKSQLIKNKILESVYPALIEKKQYLANINGVLNAVILRGSPVGQSVFQGEGAGPSPTVSSIISDLCSILRGNIKYPFGVSDKLRKKINHYDFEKYKYSGYLRIEVIDKYGVLSSITTCLAKHKVSIKRVIQIPNKKNKTASIVIITHSTSEKNNINCINKIKKSKYVLKKPVYIRIEQFK